MALKDTLEALRLGADAPGMPPDWPAALIEEWHQAVEALFDQIRGFLAPLAADGTVAFETQSKMTIEEDIGDYAIPEMIIVAANRRIFVTPIGRLVAGATGRVDLMRDGHPNQLERVMLLRVKSSGVEQWTIELSPGRPDVSRLRNLYFPNVGLARDFVPLTQDNLERAIEFLIQL